MTLAASSTLDEIKSLLKRICEVPAPTFEEEARGGLLAQLLAETGLSPQRDEVGNVTARLPGGAGPRVLIAAHLDTVFDAGVDVSVHEENGRLSAPGIGDNSASLAVLVRFVQQVMAGEHEQRPHLTVAATVGEEGLGDLYGMRHLMDTRAGEFDFAVALDGHLGALINGSVGSKRYEVRFSAAGGHSWGDFPSPSAVHALGDAVHALNQLTLSEQPRSSYNVGQVWGGTSINAIAQEAGFNLDLRSKDEKTLERLEQDALKRISKAAKKHSADLSTKLVGDRPAANVPNEPLVRAARDALSAVNVRTRLAASSTDANAAMAAGLPAVAFGVYRGGDAHRLSEWLETESLATGYQALVNFVENLSRLE